MWSVPRIVSTELDNAVDVRILQSDDYCVNIDKICPPVLSIFSMYLSKGLSLLLREKTHKKLAFSGKREYNNSNSISIQ